MLRKVRQVLDLWLFGHCLYGRSISNQFGFLRKRLAEIVNLTTECGCKFRCCRDVQGYAAIQILTDGTLIHIQEIAKGQLTTRKSIAFPFGLPPLEESF